METLTRIYSKGLIGAKSGLNARLWPNGECQIWKPRSFKAEKLPAQPNIDDVDRRMSMHRLLLQDPKLFGKLWWGLGLSPQSIFDRTSEGYVVCGLKAPPKARAKKGNTGITSYGARMVRNAAYVLEHVAGKSRCIFATVTVPNLPVEKMRIIHEQWGEVVERYRLLVKRALQDQGLSGESVTVTEIQEKRYERSGLPVLHCHTVFAGVTAWGRFAITPEVHDDMWYRALNTAIHVDRAECAVGCQLQRVKKSASAYLGKYLSKGCASVKGAIKDGFASWIPDHWWNCSRSLSRKVKSQTRQVDFLAEWLNDAAEQGSTDVWEWHRHVSIEFKDGQTIIMAVYGRLSAKITAQIMAASNSS